MWEIIEHNKRKSVFIIILIMLFYCLFGAIIGALVSFLFLDEKLMADFILTYILYGVLLSAVWYTGCVIYGFIQGKKLYIAKDMYLVTPSNNKRLINIVEEVAIASGLAELPNIFILDSNILNAYACGIRVENSSIVISRGLVEKLSRDELQGVIAHEMSHIINKDTLCILCAGAAITIISIVGAFSLRCLTRRSTYRGRSSGMVLLFFLAVALVAHIFKFITFLFYLSLSRKREYLADACAAKATRYPKGLADALSKIERYALNYKSDIINDDNPLIKSSFIVPQKEDDLFSTHPKTENRIKILLSMASCDYIEYEKNYRKITKQKNLIPKGEILNSKLTPIKELVSTECALADTPQKDEVEQKIENHRLTEDLMWSLANYTFIECECNTKLKIPPSYKGQEITCPHCKRKHFV